MQSGSISLCTIAAISTTGITGQCLTSIASLREMRDIEGCSSSDFVRVDFMF